MNKKIVRVMSRLKFDEYVDEQGWNDRNIGIQDVAVVEILDYTNLANNYNPVFTYFSDNVFLVRCDDVDGKLDNNRPFTEDDAIELFGFIEKNIDKKRFIVHCAMGVSRSGAVGRFLFDYLKSKNYDVGFPEHNSISPNGLISRLLNNQYFFNYKNS